MQPYVFPYIGYFQLIEATDTIVFYDDVNYIKRGWINRNRILMNGDAFLFTVPVEKISQNKLILEIKPIVDPKFRGKLFSQVKSAYRKAPYYKEVIEILETVFSEHYDNIADLSISSILAIYDYLGKEIKWVKSSLLSPETKGMDKADRLIQISKKMNCEDYINAIGGMSLYSKDYFKANGINLGFIRPQDVNYKQFENDFVPWLSIIDVLMFNDKAALQQHFEAYEII